jgi:Peptidase family S41
MTSALPAPDIERRRLTHGLTLAPLWPALLPAWMPALLPGPARAGAGSTLSAAQARGDLQLLRRALHSLHPGLHRRTTPAQMDASFAAAERAVAGGSTQTSMFLLCSHIAATVNCGHTWASHFNARTDLRRLLMEGNDKLPLTLRWVQGRALITGSTAPGVAAGSELLAIDGRPVDEIAAALMPLLRADGQHAGAVGKRRAQLNSGGSGGAMDWLFPLRFPSRTGRWRLTLREEALTASGAQRELSVPATSLAERQRSLPAAVPQWSFERTDDTALLRLPTFAFWNSDFKADAFLARTFTAMRNLPFMVMDLRDNEGGDDNIARQVLAHLLREPYEPPAARLESAYEQVPAELLPHLGTWNRSFFDRRGQAVPLPGAAGSRWLLPNAAAVRVEPVAAPYPGRTVALVGPQNSSAGFLFARDLQRSGAAVLMGEPTGGNLQGLNSGQLAWITLPASGVAVDIPLRASHTLGEGDDAPPDRGVLPELPVAPNFQDAAAGTDTTLAAAGALIAGWRPGPRPRVAPTS